MNPHVKLMNSKNYTLEDVSCVLNETAVIFLVLLLFSSFFPYLFNSYRLNTFLFLQYTGVCCKG